MRYVFEFLIIAKYASISGDMQFLSKWENGEDIWMSKDIFKKIQYPNSKEIKGAWKLFCEYAHGTKMSQQKSLKWIDNKEEIKLNFILIWMLFEMNYHLLNTHIMNKQVKYYLKEYGRYEDIVFFKSKLKEAFKLTKKLMGKEPKKAIKDFCLKWQIK